MLTIDLTGKRAFIAGVADDAGFGFAIAKALVEAGATVCLGTWPPALGIFEKLLERVAAFGLGTIIGMLGVSFLLGGVVRLASGRGERWATVLHVGSALGSVVVGCLLAADVLTH